MISRLKDPGFARGLITFLISVATIGLAFIMVFQAFSTDQASDDGFRRAREVFAGLMGVLGTIVGFYFGSAEKTTAPLEVAAIKAADKQLLTHVSGGIHPYRYVISSSDPNLRAIKKSSEDGWIVELLDKPPKPASTITIEVTDAAAQTTSGTINFPVAAPPATATPVSQPLGPAKN